MVITLRRRPNQQCWTAKYTGHTNPDLDLVGEIPLPRTHHTAEREIVAYVHNRNPKATIQIATQENNDIVTYYARTKQQEEDNDNATPTSMIAKTPADAIDSLEYREVSSALQVSLGIEHTIKRQIERNRAEIKRLQIENETLYNNLTAQYAITRETENKLRQTLWPVATSRK